jgi:hypothetical protein
MLLVKLEGRRKLRRPRHRWVNSIDKRKFREWIDLARDRD